MLEEHYSQKFRALIDSVSWDIELPIEWADFFQIRGEAATYADDERHNQRLKIRTHGILWFDRSLPFLARGDEPVGVYTRDFSRHGAGLLTAFEVYPQEQIRILLPAFWMQVEVIRTRRITSKCYEVGTRLIRRHDASVDAFVASGCAATSGCAAQ